MNYHSDRPRLPPLREALGYDPQRGAPPTSLPPLPPPSVRNLRYAQSYAQLPRSGPSRQPGSSLSDLQPLSLGPSRRLGPSMSTLDLRRPPGHPKSTEMSTELAQPPPSLHRRSSSRTLNSGLGGLPPTPTSATGPGFGFGFGSLGSSGSFGSFSPTSSDFPQPYSSGQPSTPTSSLNTSSHAPTSSYSGYFPRPPAGGSQDHGPLHSPGVSGQLSGFHLSSPARVGPSSSASSLSMSGLHHSQSVSGLRQSQSSRHRQGMSSASGSYLDGNVNSSLNSYQNPHGPSFFGDEASPLEPSTSRPLPSRSPFRRHSSETSLHSQSSGSSSQSAYYRPNTTIPEQDMDPFAPRSSHNFPSSSTFPRATESQYQEGALRRQRSAIIHPSTHPRGKRYLPPPGPLESMISSSGMVDSSGNLTGLPPFPPLHPGGRNMCDVCGKTFLRPSALVTHMLSHTGDRPHMCEICGRCFSVASNLRRHLKTHEQ